MYWDPDIAQRAQDWANKCTISKSPEYMKTFTSFKTGEIIYQEENEMNWEKVIALWFTEINKYTGQVSKYQKGAETNKFTQIIWANTYLVGCGFAMMKGKLKKYNNHYVCMYGPRGNINDLPIYKESIEKKPDCLQGTENKNKMYLGLCCPLTFCDWETQIYNGPFIYGTQPKTSRTQ